MAWRQFTSLLPMKTCLARAGKVKETLKECIESINYYPDSDTYEIRTALADKFNISKDNIIMGDGTDQVIEMICDCFIDRQDNIVTGDPNFLIYEKSALISGGSAKKIPLRPDFSQDIKSILNSRRQQYKGNFYCKPPQSFRHNNFKRGF